MWRNGVAAKKTHQHRKQWRNLHKQHVARVAYVWHHRMANVSANQQYVYGWRAQRNGGNDKRNGMACVWRI